MLHPLAKEEEDVRGETFEEERVDKSLPLLFVQRLKPIAKERMRMVKRIFIFCFIRLRNAKICSH